MEIDRYNGNRGIPLTEVDTICCGRGYGGLPWDLVGVGSAVSNGGGMPRLSFSIEVARRVSLPEVWSRKSMAGEGGSF